MNKIIYYTKSVCPECFKSIIAKIVEENNEIFMFKQCENHGEYKTLIWQDTAENYLKWLEYGGICINQLPKTLEEFKGSSDIDYIKNKLAYQQPTSAALMVTNRCNSDCPICFTRNEKEDTYEPDIDELKNLLGFYKKKAGVEALIEFCGGEPTVREDLPMIAKTAKFMGFNYIQLNTNGIRLSESLEYCINLSKNGITSVYLGFDGVTAEPYIYKYGKNLFEIKKKAIKNCGLANLSVILVPCIIPGINDDQLGDIIMFAKENTPVVKGVYFQPISYFGKFDGKNINRITIPEVLRKIEAQTYGKIKEDNFFPGNYEHPACSFNGYFLIGKNDNIYAITHAIKREYHEKGYIQIRKNTKDSWKPSGRKSLTIAGMAFQDICNIDTNRIKRCSIQIIGKDCNLIPLCNKYLTNTAGEKLFEGIN